MLLNVFGIGNGWKIIFEKRIIEVLKLFPGAKLVNVYKKRGMLTLDFHSEDEYIQFVLDCVAYKMERESARTCEMCGNGGRRITGDDRLPEIKCLCSLCYALELDRVLTNS